MTPVEPVKIYHAILPIYPISVKRMRMDFSATPLIIRVILFSGYIRILLLQSFQRQTATRPAITRQLVHVERIVWNATE